MHRDGDRDSWEQIVFARQERLSRATVAAAVTLDAEWVDEVANGLWLLCEQSSWCWPAHDDTFASHGSVLATVQDPFLDLGAGEVAGQLAWIDHVLGDALDQRFPGLRGRLAHETRTRALKPFLRRRDWHWLGLDGNVHNWNPWIHGNVLVAALRFAEHPADRAEIVRLVVEGIDRYVSVLPADGAIDEGYGYWWNGACRALEALDILGHATGGRLDASMVPALRSTVAFPHRMHLGGHWYLNSADGQARPTAEQPWHALHRAARAAGDVDAQAHAAASRSPGAAVATEFGGLGRLLRGLTDQHWRTAAPAQPPLPSDVWLPSVEVLVARPDQASARGLTLAIKGGHNGENHNHNDVGSFVVASDGAPVIVDAGRPTYTAATFGPDRYDIWTMQSSWHNVPEVRGTAQSAGSEFAATGVSPEVTAGRTGLALDISASYDVAGLNSWRRTAHLERTSPSRVVIEENWSLEPWEGAGDEPATTIRLLIAGDIQLGIGEARIVPLDGARPVIVRWNAEAPARLVQRTLDDPMLSIVWGNQLHRLDIDVTLLTALRITIDLHSTKGLSGSRQ